MVPHTNGKSYTPEQLAIVVWTAGLGAITAETYARHANLSPASARARLSLAERAGLLASTRVLAARPPLYTVTQAGLRAALVRGIEPCRVSAATALHALACAEVAAALEHAYRDHTVMGERELRRDERRAGAPLASASLGRALHRPDLVLWPTHADELLPVAVEVELTVKAPRRLEEICRAWARTRCVAGVLYLAPVPVQRPLVRAIERAAAGGRVVLVSLDTLADPHPAV